MKKVTMKDVAAAAGVSVAAVSRVMNGSGYVAPDKREAILQAISTAVSYTHLKAHRIFGHFINIGAGGTRITIAAQVVWAQGVDIYIQNPHGNIPFYSYYLL